MTTVRTNIFRTLGLNYEVFHTRVLLWLWTPDADHGGGDRFLQALSALIGVTFKGDVPISPEMKIDVPGQQRWRLADLVLRTSSHFVLVENKVDPGYQDIEQIRDEIDGGMQMAQAEARQFKFVFLAPGPIAEDVRDVIGNRGIVVTWSQLREAFVAVPIADLDPAARLTIEQYLDFIERPAPTVRAGVARNNELLDDCEQALTTLVKALPLGTEVTAADLWPSFLEQYPDHATALAEQYADTKYYSAKSWFSARLQRMAATRQEIEDTNTWEMVDGNTWGFPKVRVYRRIES